ncbi:MAG TPA: PepSY domain-containing protein [Chloroflexia bacterium]|nr:PepSY domain-containing protein [Chloroflexia bacterium]
MDFQALFGSPLAAILLAIAMLGHHTTSAPQVSAPALAVRPPSAVFLQTAPPAATTITKAQAELAALAASPGQTVDHTRLSQVNGKAVYDVDFANGGGAQVDATTGAIIVSEAAGMDHGGRGGRDGGNQAALAAKATVTKAQAEAAALAASPGNTVDHSRLGDDNGTVFWDVDFSNRGGVRVNALTGAILAREAAGTDHGGHAPGAAPGNR